MFTFDITKYVPQFILADKNGYAIAKAIEAAMQIVNDTVQTGADCVLNVDTMPEWRLDEVAWELNCLYDYNADIEVKRDWIKNAIPYYRIFGTPKSIKRYIGAYFEGVELDENWVYNGEPFHFRVIVEGEWTPYNEAWARKAIDKAKNVRSVLDSLDIGCRTFIGITAECEMLARFAYPLTGPENYAGRWPQENYIGILDETPHMGADATAEGHKFQYPLTGVRPEINTLGVLDESKTGIDGQIIGTHYEYPMASENRNTGTHPQENYIGIAGENDIQAAEAEDLYTVVPYRMCGSDDF